MTRTIATIISILSIILNFVLFFHAGLIFSPVYFGISLIFVSIAMLLCLRFYSKIEFLEKFKYYNIFFGYCFSFVLLIFLNISFLESTVAEGITSLVLGSIGWFLIYGGSQSLQSRSKILFTFGILGNILTAFLGFGYFCNFYLAFVFGFWQLVLLDNLITNSKNKLSS